MALYLSLKWAVVLVIALAAVLVVPQTVTGNYSLAGGMFARWIFASLAILAIATWDEWKLAKKEEEEKN